MATNKVTNQKYIGQTIKPLKQRIKEHLKNKIGRFGKAIEKYGSKNFEWTVLEDNIDNIKHLNLLEKFWMVRYNTLISTCGYNQRKGGTSFVRGNISQETRFKMSIGQNRWRAKQGIEKFESDLGRSLNWDQDAKWIERLDPLGLVIPKPEY